jgi:hypothetical protein
MMSGLYRNPFSGVNAVQLTEAKILEYWCNPFIYDLFTEIKEEDVYGDEMNIVFMGGRSTGKSMFLRYWSFPVQLEIARRGNIPVSDKLRADKGIGLYFRIDGPKLKSFFGNGLSDDYWSALFTNYFELLVGRQYIEILIQLAFEKVFNQQILSSDLVPGLNEIFQFQDKGSLDEILQEIDNRIREVEVYLGNVPFYKEPFLPSHRGYLSQSLSFGIAKFLTNKMDYFREINFVLLLDEYENFLEYQQKSINTLLRFTQSQIKFRIGMRLEGFRTFAMISEDDFIKVGREYREVRLEEIVNIKKGSSYFNFLVDVSKKRLEAVPAINERKFTNIKSILSEKENVEQDALELYQANENAIINFFANSKKVPLADLEKVRSPNKPLLELMNCILLTRGNRAEDIKAAMEDYLARRKTDAEKKYRLDYVHKYKLSLSFLLCSIYRTNKLYYSFNTFAFLSSGIIGHFIELCRIAFDEAGWADNESLMNRGEINKQFQNNAAVKLSNTEKRQINRIETYGGIISRFIDNIGNIFREYHLDFKMRYPEVNQFAINVDAIQNEKTQKALKAAIKWTVIQKKPTMQTTGPNESLQDLYTINRVLAPVFQISYRTRGGKSVILNETIVNDLISSDKINISLFPKDEPIGKKGKNSKPPDLFSQE